MMHATAPLELSYPAVPDAPSVMARAGGENFPVAARLLSGRDRRALLAVYGFARLTDELGDELSGDRVAALDWLEAELDRAYAGAARHPLLQRLQAVLEERQLPRQPFARLIEANRLDQRVARYETWEQLRGYCELSANPVGELVLCAFELATPERVALSNEVCTALQLAEHLQDVAEDARRGRVYLPAEDLARFGCSQEQLSKLFADGGRGMDLRGVLAGSSTRSEEARHVATRLREAVRFEVARGRDLMGAGLALVASVSGRRKLAVAGFVAGGRAALDAIEEAGFDVLAGAPRAGRGRRAGVLARVLAESRA